MRDHVDMRGTERRVVAVATPASAWASSWATVDEDWRGQADDDRGGPLEERAVDVDAPARAMTQLDGRSAARPPPLAVRQAGDDLP